MLAWQNTWKKIKMVLFGMKYILITNNYIFVFSQVYSRLLSLFYDFMGHNEYDFLEIRILVAASFRKRKTERSKKNVHIAADYRYQSNMEC